MRILVTGATGYIGGRLIPVLLERGHEIRVLVRDPARIAGRPWETRVEIVGGDILRPATLPPALDGVDAAYYLVHSMYAGRRFEDLDRRAARHFAEAARGVGKVIYLGGILPAGPKVSSHLRSRAEVGTILQSEVPTTEFRAGPIIGSGSASFEMVRYLTERLPVMIAPIWIRNEVMPISIEDILRYLPAALDRDALGVVEIGAERLPFRRLLEVYAEVRGYRRTIIPVPVLTPTLAALWVGLVTPIPNRLAVPLIQGVVRPVVADTGRARETFPDIEPVSYRRAVEIALAKIQECRVETRWSGSLAGAPAYEVSDREGVFREVRNVHVGARPEDVFAVFTALGGDRGWLAWDWAWRIRGLIDRLAGGPGLRRGRRDPEELLCGEAVDFWRVEGVSPPTGLRLRAEMRLPGVAWLEWEAEPEGDGTRLTQTASFEPRGLAGALYWWSLYPLHRILFADLTRAVARTAEQRPGTTSSPGDTDPRVAAGKSGPDTHSPR